MRYATEEEIQTYKPVLGSIGIQRLGEDKTLYELCHLDAPVSPLVWVELLDEGVRVLTESEAKQEIV